MWEVGKKKSAITRSNLIRLALVLFDAVAVNLAYYMALVIRFYVNNEFNEWAVRYVPEFWKFVPYYTVFCLIVFSGFRLYTRRWKYASTEDLNRILMANIVTCVGHMRPPHWRKGACRESFPARVLLARSPPRCNCTSNQV